MSRPQIPASLEGNSVQLRAGRSYRITLSGPRARWSVTRADVGQQVELIVEQAPGDDGSTHTLTIWEHDTVGAHDEVTTVEGTLRSGTLRATWTCEPVSDEDDILTAYELLRGESVPELFFTVTLGGAEVSSGQTPDELLLVHDRVEVTVLGAHQQILARLPYTLVFPDGTTREGQTDGQGRIVEEELAAGRVRLVVEPPEEDGDDLLDHPFLSWS